jgi:hypothetical protein
MTNTAIPRTQRIGIFVYPDFEPIDVWGFAEAFSIARFLGTGYSDPPPYPFEIVLISRDGGNVKSINGPSVAPDWDFKKALQQPLDLLMIPGGGGTWPLLDDKNHPADVKALIDWVHAMDGKVKIMASVCTGASWHTPGCSTGCRPRPIMVRSIQCGCGARRCCGTASRAGSMPENTSLPPASRPAPTWGFTWCPGWRGGR